MIQRSRTLFPWLAALGLAFAFTAAGGAARAQSTCATDADCAEGLACQVVGGTACAEPACPPGETCPEPLPCEPQEFYGCVPGPCTSDADCGEGLRCLTSTITECSGGAPCADPNTCTPEPEQCVTRSESLCAPAWFAPCETAADCGEGFECVAEEQCACGGSPGGGVGGASSTDGGAPEPADCVCEPTGVNRCQPLRTTCAADADCPSGWTCVPDPETAVCSGGTGGSTGSGGAGGVSSGGVSGAGGAPDPCGDPPPVENVCMPPYAELGGPGGGEASGAGNEGGEVTYGPPRADTGANPVSSEDSGGCAVAPARTSGSELAFLGLLAALGLGGAARRRR